jgi:hypothetical protein
MNHAKHDMKKTAEDECEKIKQFANINYETKTTHS